MKKYDLYIAGIYVTIMLMAFIFLFYSYKQGMNSNEDLRDLFNSPPVNKIVINDYKGDLTISMEDSLPGSREDWKLNGIMTTDKVSSLYIEDSTLYINNASGWRVNLLNMYVRKGITVEINNSPKVQIVGSQIKWAPTTTTWYDESGNIIKEPKQ